MNNLEKRVLEISRKKKLSHLGSCLTAVNIIDTAYQMMNDKDIFILSSGHAALAWYVVLEKYMDFDAEELYDKHGTHPNRDVEHDMVCSSGSLGHGLPIAVGMALANRDVNVYCLISDGECSEGSIWEAIRIAAEQKLENLIILVNANGFGAYKQIDLDRLQWMLGGFVIENCPKISFIPTTHKFDHIQGLDAHYCKLTDKQYEEVLHEN